MTALLLGLVTAFFAILPGFPQFQQPSSVAEPQSPEMDRYQSTEYHMGVEFQIVLYAENERNARKAFEAAFGEIARLNEMLSDYDPESELSRLGAGAPHADYVPLSPEFAEVMQIGLEVSRRSDGAFDPTLGQLTRLWRRARRNERLPPQERLNQAMEASGYEAVEWSCDKTMIKLTKPDLRLDLGGIAKGYAADRALLVLAELGIKSAFVNASGDITLGDPPPGREGWGVGVAPLDATREPSRIVVLSNCGVATSGDAWQAVIVEGVRYSHILNPKTGIGLTQRSSVTVVAPNGTLADAWASAVSVLGPQSGIALINKVDELESLVVYLEDEETKIVKSERFPEE